MTFSQRRRNIDALSWSLQCAHLPILTYLYRPLPHWRPQHGIGQFVNKRREEATIQANNKLPQALITSALELVNSNTHSSCISLVVYDIIKSWCVLLQRLSRSRCCNPAHCPAVSENRRKINMNIYDCVLRTSHRPLKILRGWLTSQLPASKRTIKWGFARCPSTINESRVTFDDRWRSTSFWH